MSARDRSEALLAELRALEAQPDPGAARRVIRRCLGSRNSVAAARGARLAAELALEDLSEELASTLGQLLGQPFRSDPGCRAKTALAKALLRLESAPAELLLQGARHVQLEPVWGGQEDSAPELRGTCLLGLVAVGDPDADLALADGLADPARGVRISAARGFAQRGTRDGAAVLRLKLRLGDPDPLVLMEALRALLLLEPVESLELARELLERPETAEPAALALGESRRPDALPLLRSWWEELVEPDRRRIGLQALALLRSDEALELLLEQVAQGRRQDALNALEALELYSGDMQVKERIRRAASERTDLEPEEKP